MSLVGNHDQCVHEVRGFGICIRLVVSVLPRHMVEQPVSILLILQPMTLKFPHTRRMKRLGFEQGSFEVRDRHGVRSPQLSLGKRVESSPCLFISRLVASEFRIFCRNKAWRLFLVIMVVVRYPVKVLLRRLIPPGIYDSF